MLDKLKKALKITSSEQDALLEELLLQSRMIVERRLWYSLEKKIYTEVLNSDNQTSLFFLQAPILDIIKITWGTVKKLRKNALYLKKPICKEITVEYLDRNWQKQTLILKDFPAQICQHELDHLEGILI